MQSTNYRKPNGSQTLIDQLLGEQQTLTAVEKFARAHAAESLPAQAKFYRDLIPLSAPRAGEQYAFEVDLDQCSGCKACVTACHSLNGLDEGETWRGVGLLVSAPTISHSSRSAQPAVQQHVTTACHHCVDPGCLNGCPVLAYEKDSVTGIVRHLDDQCIGCQYCVLMCPYEVPKYSEARGIVRKCDMCSSRLAVGEAPACVQACPNEAIRITVVKKESVAITFRTPTRSRESHLQDANSFLADSPNPATTLPTTRYLSAKPLTAQLVAADSEELRLQPMHGPLVWMLVFTQLAAGGFALLPFVAANSQVPLATISLTACLFGLAGSTMHLGKPLKAWRAFLGLRRSWLSREIVIFGGFAPLAIATTVALLKPSLVPEALRTPLLWTTAITGLIGVLCSAMIYHDTQRVFWRGALSLGKFFGTTISLGLAAAWFACAFSNAPVAWLAPALAAAGFIKLTGELRFLRRCPDDDEITGETPSPSSWLARSAMLMRFQLGGLLRARITLGWLGVVFPLIGGMLSIDSPRLAGTTLLICLISELAERALFFRAVVPPRMPGGVAA